MIMSCITKSQFKYLNNNDKEKFYLAENEDDDSFDFQYVPVNQFKHIIKDVRRQRVRDEEERIWTSFLKEQEQAISNYQTYSGSRHKSSRTFAESLEEVDKELMRLEADALPETDIQIDSISARDYKNRNPLIKSTKKNSPVTKENGTGSTNFLLTIPEEESVYCMTESSQSHKPCRTYVKKSCSDQTFKNNRIHSRCYHYSSNLLDCNSSPDISSDCSSNENDSIRVHPDPVAVTKILGIQRKISTVLDSISNELDRIPLPDGENDLHRRQQRMVEFSTRLSRNYLYDLGRQISDIQRHLKAIAPDNKMRLSRRGIILHMQAIEQKLISAHQLLLTALNAYWKHIPSSVLKNHPGKLKEILQIVVQLKNICTEIKLSPDYYCSGDDIDAFLGKETENRCCAILSKFKLQSDNESQVLSHTTRSTIATSSRNNNKNKNRKTLSNRLSMYAMDMRLAKSYQPKKSHSMFQISRDKKQKCLTTKQQQSNNLAASKKSRLSSFSKTSNEAIGKITKISIPLKEDDIQTIMETVPSNVDVESSRSIKSGKKTKFYDESHKAVEIYENAKELKRLNKNAINNYKVLTNDDSREQCFSSLLPVVGDLLSLVKNKQNNSKPETSASIDTFYDLLQKCQPKEDSRESQHSCTNDRNEIGDKNMRVICYHSKDEEENKTFNVNKRQKEVMQLSDASCQVNYVNKNGMCELLVPEPAIMCLTEYRNQYHHLSKSNPMYTSNTQNKPWEVISWIADKLIDELIVELSDDFQIGDIIQKLFDLEFQEF